MATLGALKGVRASSPQPVSLLSPAFTSDRQQLPQEQRVIPVWGQPSLAQSTPGRARVSQQVPPQPGLLPAMQHPLPGAMVCSCTLSHISFAFLQHFFVVPIPETFQAPGPTSTASTGDFVSSPCSMAGLPWDPQLVKPSITSHTQCQLATNPMRGEIWGC